MDAEPPTEQLTVGIDLRPHLSLPSFLTFLLSNRNSATEQRTVLASSFFPLPEDHRFRLIRHHSALDARLTSTLR